jgi:glucose/arabinose dehydrogenase
MVGLTAGLAFGCQQAVRRDPGPLAVQLVKVAELSEPTVLAVRTRDDRLYIGEKSGRVRAVSRDGVVLPGTVLDLSAEVSSGFEQGLLGMAFAPTGNLLYVGITDLQGDTRIIEFPFKGRRADPSRRRELLFLDQPHHFHNNGNVLFGPDGMLYLGLGDGGTVRYEEHRAQDLGSLFGKVLRIDPRPRGAQPYTIPPDNPFGGRPGARPEVWLYGLRNPWRFSFDASTGDMWLADVGEARAEEVNYLAKGLSGVNFGWDALEGTAVWDSPERPPDSPRWNAPEPPEHTLPLLEYRHTDGRCVIIGGYVYRGRRIPQLQGSYLYGDLCSGRLTGLRQRDGAVLETFDLGVQAEQITSLGEDRDGELYVLSQASGLFKLVPRGG